MSTKNTSSKTIRTAIEPWLTVGAGANAVAFYTAAFNAKETYRMEDPGGGLVVKLEIDGAGFWISSDSNYVGSPDNGGVPMRMILVSSDPDTLFAKAIAAGAKEIFPVGEEHGWKLGRIADPFGFHWEIGYQV